MYRRRKALRVSPPLALSGNARYPGRFCVQCGSIATCVLSGTYVLSMPTPTQSDRRLRFDPCGLATLQLESGSATRSKHRAHLFRGILRIAQHGARHPLRVESVLELSSRPKLL